MPGQFREFDLCPKVHPSYYATIKRALNRTRGVVILLLRVIAAGLAATAHLPFRQSLSLAASGRTDLEGLVPKPVTYENAPPKDTQGADGCSPSRLLRSQPSRATRPTYPRACRGAETPCRGPGAAKRDVGSARGHLQRADRAAAGIRSHRRACHPTMRGALQWRRALRGWTAASCGGQQPFNQRSAGLSQPVPASAEAKFRHGPGLRGRPGGAL